MDGIPYHDADIPYAISDKFTVMLYREKSFMRLNLYLLTVFLSQAGIKTHYLFNTFRTDALVFHILPRITPTA